MARITKGILGGFSGKVGTVVGASFRGQDIIRSKPKPSSKKPTDKQLLQQAKFSLTIAFLQPLKPIQHKYFGVKSGAKSEVNLAVSYFLKNAIQVIANIPELLYTKILITKGDLTGFQNLTALPQANQVIEISWEDNSTQGNANATDQVNLVCYSEVLGSFEIFELLATRADLTTQVTLPALYANLDVHVWAYLNNAAESVACNSNYLGVHTVL